MVSLHTTINKELKKRGLVNDINFAEAVEIGVNMILKRREGLPGLRNELKKLINSRDTLDNKINFYKLEIEKSIQREKEDKEIYIKEKEIKDSTCPVCQSKLTPDRTRMYKGIKFCSTCAKSKNLPKIEVEA